MISSPSAERFTVGTGEPNLFRASLKRIYNDLERTDDTVSH